MKPRSSGENRSPQAASSVSMASVGGGSPPPSLADLHRRRRRFARGLCFRKTYFLCLSLSLTGGDLEFTRARRRRTEDDDQSRCNELLPKQVSRSFSAPSVKLAINSLDSLALSRMDDGFSSVHDMSPISFDNLASVSVYLFRWNNLHT